MCVLTTDLKHHYYFHGVEMERCCLGSAAMAAEVVSVFMDSLNVFYSKLCINETRSYLSLTGKK